jgi:hypothetical protein
MKQSFYLLVFLGFVSACNFKSAAEKSSNVRDSKEKAEPRVWELASKGTVFGWDPNFSIKRAVSPWPRSPVFFESCPEVPGGKCVGTVPNGGGFYSLAYGSVSATKITGPTGYLSCLPNSFGADARKDWVFTEDIVPATTGPCPYGFYWGDRGPNGTMSALFLNNSLSLSSPLASSLYIGLQENSPVGPDQVAGMTFGDPRHTINWDEVAGVSFSFRAQTCLGDKASDTYKTVRSNSDMIFFSQSQNKGFGVSVTFLDYVVTNGAADVWPHFTTDPFLAEFPTPMQHINGRSWGYTPADYGFEMDSTPFCSRQITDLPWKKIYIPFGKIVRRMVAEGKIPESALSGAKLAGTIVAGIEQWGRLSTQLEISERRLWKGSPDFDPFAQGSGGAVAAPPAAAPVVSAPSAGGAVAPPPGSGPSRLCTVSGSRRLLSNSGHQCEVLLQWCPSFLLVCKRDSQWRSIDINHGRAQFPGIRQRWSVRI